MLHTADSARRVGASMTAASVCILSGSACSAPKEPRCSPRRAARTAWMRSGAAARPVLHLRCVLVTTRGGCGLGRPLFRREGKPAVEVVEDGFDGWSQFGGDLLLALALAGAASGLCDDDLEDAGP